MEEQRMDFNEQIKPFCWVEHDSGSVSLCLPVGSYKTEIFDTRAEEGFEGNGYDWGSLALVFPEKKMPEEKKQEQTLRNDKLFNNAARMKYPDVFKYRTPSEELVERCWKGSIDMHIHFAPDPAIVRRFDGYQTALAARDAGMRAIVLKSPHIPTVQTAFAVQRALPEITVFGSINIENATTGGLGETALAAIENSAAMGAKVLWFPTSDAAFACSATPGMKGKGLTILEAGGKLKAIVPEILAIVKQYGMVLCSGHLSYPESVALFEEAQRQGIDKMIATHPLADVLWEPYTLEEIHRLAAMGVYIEHCYRCCMPLLGSYRPEKYVEAIRLIGAHQTILSTDFGQITDASPAEGMRQFIATMLQMNVGEEDITLMVKQNPAKLLDL
jgi:hypothetical protein